MADFKPIFENTLKKEGGFQKFSDDSANYVNGVLIGTNRGISAQAYYTFYGRVPTEADMKALSQDQAYQIFKKNYWNKINGDKIKNQSVAAMMFQFIIGSGASQLSDLKDIANKVNGKDVLSSNDTPFTDSQIEFINGLNQLKYWEALKKWRHEFYIKLVAKKPGLKKFLNGWQSRLNSYVFKDDSGIQNLANNAGKVLVFFFALSLIGVGAYISVNKS